MICTTYVTIVCTAAIHFLFGSAAYPLADITDPTWTLHFYTTLTHEGGAVTSDPWEDARHMASVRRV